MKKSSSTKPESAQRELLESALGPDSARDESLENTLGPDSAQDELQQNAPAWNESPKNGIVQDLSQNEPGRCGSSHHGSGSIEFTDELAEKEQQLISELLNLNSVVVAYSGGVDSSLVAYYARKVLHEKAKVVIAVSPSLANDDLSNARAQAEQFNWDLVEITTDEFESSDYQRNDSMRCFFCKSTLFEHLSVYAEKHGVASIVYGANLDDASDFRPGRIAAERHNVKAPLSQLNKEEIRKLARHAGLPSWDKPQNACLSSRVVTGIPVTVDVVSKVEAGEKVVKSLGFKVVRVRHHGEKAVVEVGRNELFKFTDAPHLVREIKGRLGEVGYKEVTIDYRGYRQGGASMGVDDVISTTDKLRCSIDEVTFSKPSAGYSLAELRERGRASEAELIEQ